MATARTYNARYKLTYHKPSKGWKKVYKGTTHYLKSGRGAKTDSNYQLALAEWEALKQGLDGDGDFTESKPVQSTAQPDAKPNALGRLPDDPPWIIARGIDGIEKHDRFGHLVPNGKAGAESLDERSIEGLVSLYLSQRRTQVESGELSSKQYGEDKAKLNDWLAFCSLRGIEEIEQVTGVCLGEYQDATKRATIPTDDRKAISKTTAKKRLAVLRKWLDWCMDMEVIQTLPRIHRKLARIELPKPTPRSFDLDDVRYLFSEATQRTKLYIALALNCGFTQKDIATLTQDMIDWDSRIVTRERQKTGVESKHRLWPVTLALLERERSNAKTGLLLLNNTGRSLLTEGINAKGNHKETDSIRLAFNRLTRRLEKNDAKRAENGKPKLLKRDRSMGLKYFRKTSSDLIARQFQEQPQLTSMFLAHSDNAMKWHYVSKHYDLLFEAIDWLDTQYRLQLDDSE